MGLLSVYSCLSGDDMESSCQLFRFDAAGADFSGTVLKYVGDHFPLTYFIPVLELD